MGLETGTYIDSLNTSNPGATDSVAQGDDHIRLLKSTIKNTFPNITGAMTATHTELNLLDGCTANTTELNYVDIATLGTAEASKALTVDASKDVTGIRNITATGALSVGSGTVGGNTIATLANIYPVGSIYMNASDSTNPATLLGFGTWVAFGAGRVPVGQNTSDSDFNTLEETGGEKNHTLTIAEIPSHTHNQPAGLVPPPNANDVDVTGGNATTISSNVATDATGGGQGHNNLQPYIVVKMWKRTA
jgi:hypothetical protein